MVWRGASMMPEWIQPFKQAIGSDNFVCLPGSTSTSRSPAVALKFALPENPSPGSLPVIFLTCIKNWSAIEGMMMNSEAYSSYPSEGEFLLREGFMCYVLDVEKKVEIKNQNQSIDKFRGNKVTLIYLVSAD